MHPVTLWTNPTQLQLKLFILRIVMHLEDDLGCLLDRLLLRQFVQIQLFDLSFCQLPALAHCTPVVAPKHPRRFNHVDLRALGVVDAREDGADSKRSHGRVERVCLDVVCDPIGKSLDGSRKTVVVEMRDGF